VTEEAAPTAQRFEEGAIKKDAHWLLGWQTPCLFLNAEQLEEAHQAEQDREKEEEFVEKEESFPIHEQRGETFDSGSKKSLLWAVPQQTHQSSFVPSQSSSILLQVSVLGDHGETLQLPLHCIVHDLEQAPTHTEQDCHIWDEQQECVLHDLLEEPLQYDQPQYGLGLLQLLYCVHQPQLTLQLPQELQPPFLGEQHACVLHDLLEDQLQFDQPWAGLGFVHDLVCVHQPQLALQEDREVRHPFIGQGSETLQEALLHQLIQEHVHVSLLQHEVLETFHAWPTEQLHKEDQQTASSGGGRTHGPTYHHIH